ncbi:hypothetical protein ABH966_004087 [Lysinibacillus sp. RC46]
MDRRAKVTDKVLVATDRKAESTDRRAKVTEKVFVAIRIF